MGGPFMAEPYDIKQPIRITPAVLGLVVNTSLLKKRALSKYFNTPALTL
jgi:hypothetical protein